MKNTTVTSFQRKSILSLCLPNAPVLAGLLAAACLVSNAWAGTAFWSAGGADTNWSTGGNWSGGTGTAGVPASTDDVVFGNNGNATAITAISNVVNSSSTIFSLQYTNNVAASFQNTKILPGLTLTVTNNTGPFNSALLVGTPAGASVATSINASIQGAGGTLIINNTNASIAVSQAGSSSTLATLNLTNLDTFTGSVNVIAIGDFLFGSAAAAAQGVFYLAKTNTIATFWVGSHASPYSTANQPTNAIQLGVGSPSTLGGINALYLGLTNGIFTDSIGVGGVKSGGSAAAPCLIAFAPVFTNSSPTAYFRGINGSNSRISLWGVGDTAINSGSSAQAFGKVDLSGGSVDAMIDSLILGRDRNGTAALDGGVFTFTAGNVNINTLEAGDQGSSSGGSACSGAMNVLGAGATLTVNTTLELGHTTLTGGPANALNTRGVLTIVNGTANVNNAIVGASSITNIIAMSGATLNVTNTLATNASGLFLWAATNSTLGLTITDASRKALVQTLTTGGTSNLVQLASVPVFASYPMQFALIKYTTLNGAGFNFSLTNIPASAPGTYLSNNIGNASIDLVLPTNPAPVIASQASSFAGNPGSSTTFTVLATGNPNLAYQWFYTNAGSITPLSDGSGPSGSSTLSGTATNSLAIGSATNTDSGGYFVVVTNTYGAATSSVALLLINSGGLPIVTGPFNLTVIQSNNAVFSGSIAANPAASIQWQRDGTNIPGATDFGSFLVSSETVTNVQYPANDQEVFSLIASNSFGLVTNKATLTVIVPPTIITQPTNLVVTNTQFASFTVVQTGGQPAPTYQWKKNNVVIDSTANPSAATSTLTFASASPSNMATYSVVIQNSAGAVTSSNATLTVNSLMSVATLSPTNGQTGVCYDTPLYITFSQVPSLGAAGKIKIFNVTNSATPVDTLDLGQGNVQARSPFPGDSQGFNYYPVIVTGTTAAIYPHSGVLTSNQSYYVTVDNGAFTDNAGAYFTGITDTNAWRFTTKPTGPANPTNFVVAADGSGSFVTVQGAVDFIPLNNTNYTLVNIHNGNYVEIVNISGKSNITFRGQSRAGTIVGYANNGILNGSTHNRMAFKVNASDISLDNLTITNSTAQDLSQAEALMIETAAARIIVNNCNVDSYQDTVLANTATSKAYFNRSLIQGDVDFIWGGGNLFFTNCEVRWLIRAGNAVALGPNPSPQATEVASNQFSFVNCALTTLPGANPNDNVGRTRSIAGGNTALINCFVSTNIGGWAADALPTNLFRNWYYGCTNDLGASVTLSNGIPLGAADPNIALAGSATNWLYGWTPALTPNIVGQPASVTVSQGQATNFSVSATGIPDPTYQWQHAGTNVPSGTSATLAIASAQRSNGGNYAVVVNNGSGSVTSQVATLTYLNTSPVVANIVTNNVTAGLAWKIAISNLQTAAGWSDADGDPVTLSSVTSPSARGTNVTSDGIFIYYNGAVTAEDHFAYTVGDGFGGITGGTVYLEAVAGTAPTVSNPAVNGSGHPTFSGSGIPGYTYGVERATSIGGPWVNAGTVTPAANGSWSFTDVSQTNPGTIFYRLYYPFSAGSPPQ